MPDGFGIPPHYVEFLTSAHSRLTLPTTGTLATRAGAETLTETGNFTLPSSWGVPAQDER